MAQEESSDLDAAVSSPPAPFDLALRCSASADAHKYSLEGGLEPIGGANPQSHATVGGSASFATALT